LPIVLVVVLVIGSPAVFDDDYEDDDEDEEQHPCGLFRQVRSVPGPDGRGSGELAELRRLAVCGWWRGGARNEPGYDRETEARASVRARV